MSTDTPSGPASSGGPQRSTVTRWVLIGAAVVIVVALALTFWPRGGSGSPTATNSPVANYHPTPATETATPDPVVTPVKPDPSATPDPSASFIPHARKPVGLATKTAVVDGLTVQITSVAAVAGVGTSPGDVNAPSIQVRMTVVNKTGKAAKLANVVVNAYYGKANTPASQLPKPGGQSFPASVANGASAKGVFIFSVPKDQRSKVTISFDYSVKTTVVVFQGSAPK